MELEDIKRQLDENSKKIINNMNQIHQNSGALEILKDFKGDNKRIFVILLIVLFMWFSTICGFVYYIKTTAYEVITETAETQGEGNACVGDNCNNGVINGKGIRKSAGKYIWEFVNDNN